jgi:LDH2 family malate/lactate/ureidoglycolate dehydrogenase
MSAAGPFAPDVLRDLVQAMLVAAGASAEDAAVVADEVVDAEERGYESQGLVRVPNYVQLARSGQARSPSEPEVLSETPATLALDARHGWGHVIALDAMRRCVAKARRAGACVAAVRNLPHVGRLGYYVEAAAAEGMIGVLAISGGTASAMMAPWGGSEARLSTNPLAIGFPNPDGGPVVTDISTTQAARGRVLVAAAAGQPIPDTWALDAGGNPTTDPTQALPPAGTLAPLGGHKGYALAIAVELLCGGLGGPYPPPQASGFVAAIDPEALSPGGGLATAVRIASAAMSSSAPRAGFDEVLMPGAGSARRKAKAGEEGVYVVAEVWEAVRAAADGLGLQVAV